MRKEASIDLWQELYEVACKIRNLEPWNYLWDMDLIGIDLGEEMGTVYCSVMGRGGECYGISVYSGMEGLRDFDRVASQSWGGVPPEQFMLDQDCLTCYWGDREEVPSKQKKQIKDLGYKFRGRGNWLYFISYKKRYFPFTPNEQEVKLLVQTYKNLFMVCRALREKALASCLDANHILWRQYNQQSGEWHTSLINRPVIDLTFPELKLEDLFLKKQLQRKPKIGLDLIVDVAYINASVNDSRYDRPVSTLFLIAINAADGNIVTLEVLEPAQNDQAAVLDFFVDFTRQNGRVNTLVTRNPKVKAALKDICKYCKIPLIECEVEEVDFVLEMLENSL